MELKPGYKQTEVGVIPEDWEAVFLDSVTKRGSGHTPDKAHPEYWGGTIKWISLQDSDRLDHGYIDDTAAKITPAGIANSSAKVHPEGTVVLSRDAGVGKSAIMKNEMAVSQHFIAWSCSASLNNHFLYYWLQSKKSEFERIAMGSTIKTIGLPYFKHLKIPLPTKTEQTAIANALRDADALIQSLTRLIAKKRQIKQGTMQNLLNPYENGRLKAGWVVKKLGNVATLKARIGWQGLTTAEYRKTGDYFLITGTEFSNGYIDWESCFYVDFLRYKQDRNIQIKENDVLVTKDGTIGKVAFIKRPPKPATLNSGVFVIRPIDESFHPEFFYYVLLSDIFDRFLSQLSAGSTINHLYQKDFVNFEFYVPEDNKEQIRIATILSDMDTEIAALEAKLAKYQQIKQGMMQNLLTGRIRLVKLGSNTGAVA